MTVIEIYKCRIPSGNWFRLRTELKIHNNKHMFCELWHFCPNQSIDMHLQLHRDHWMWEREKTRRLNPNRTMWSKYILVGIYSRILRKRYHWCVSVKKPTRWHVCPYLTYSFAMNDSAINVEFCNFATTKSPSYLFWIFCASYRSQKPAQIDEREKTEYLYVHINT